VTSVDFCGPHLDEEVIWNNRPADACILQRVAKRRIDTAARESPSPNLSVIDLDAALLRVEDPAPSSRGVQPALRRPTRSDTEIPRRGTTWPEFVGIIRSRETAAGILQPINKCLIQRPQRLPTSGLNCVGVGRYLRRFGLECREATWPRSPLPRVALSLPPRAGRASRLRHPRSPLA
jgi:hypothetical protein